MSGFIADFQQHWYLYASMPFIAAAIGYVTKIVAIYMMFNPIEFIGYRPLLLGWQGIVPGKAATMASIACDTMTAKLLKPVDIFSKLDPERIAKEVEKPLLDSVDEIVRDVASHYQPGLWETLPEMIRTMIVQRVQAEAPRIVKHMMQDIKDNIDSVFDLKDMVISNLVKDKQTLCDMFLQIGAKEFTFIRNSGAFFGFGIGCVQALAWMLTHSSYIMPAFGGFTGWFTDWLALKMIFRPQEPTKYLGLFTWQGLFAKRRKEISASYGEMVADRIVTPHAVLDALMRGPASDRLFAMVSKEVKKLVDDQAGLAKPLVVFAVGGSKYQEMKEVIAKKVLEIMPETMSHVEKYAGEALDIRGTLRTKMQDLNAQEFEGLLRPAFQADEWKLIAAGAILGFLVGELQVHLLLS